MAKEALAVPSAQARVATTAPKRRTNWGAIGRYIALVFVLVIALGPFYWTAITSIKVDSEINQSPPTLFPQSFTTKSYSQAFISVQPAFAKDLLNSTIVAILTTILALIFGSICAYAIARTKFRGKAGVLAIILSVQMFPLIALVGPLFVFFTNTINVYNTYVALIIPYLVISLPVTVYFLTSFFRELPPDLEEAARIDGCSRLGTLWRIILPLAAPGVFTTAILSFDAQGLLVSRNTILDTNDNGIEILRTAIGDDGSQVLDNRIEDIKAGPGGSGQYGNAINAFRAGNVIVRGNRIRNCDYSAVRGNSASNIQITGNSISDVREVALYSEFSFEGAVIANNTVDGAAVGVSVCNFNVGGRIAVVQGNIIRNLLAKRPLATAPDDDAGVGIYIEADSSVTGNVIENAPSIGIVAGWGKYLRDVAISGNVIRNAFVGIGVSVVPGAGTALVNNNMISETPRGAVVGLDHARPVTPDLSAEGAQRFAQVVMGTNAVRR